jgi:hypothetical protein
MPLLLELIGTPYLGAIMPLLLELIKTPYLGAIMPLLLELTFSLTELEDGAVAELDFAVTELELVSPTVEETGGGVAELVALTAELERDSTVALEVVSAAELEVGSTLVPELEFGVICGAVGVLLLSQAFQKNAVIASKIFFQCLYILTTSKNKAHTPLIYVKKRF